MLLYFGYTDDARCMTTGGRPQGCFSIRLARSADGLNFVLDPGNILTPRPGATQLADPNVYQVPDGRWYILYGDVEVGRSPTMRVAIRSQ